jgi:hypothetical protein
MRKRSYGTLLGTGLAGVVLAIALAVTPSLATTATAWTVYPGGSFSGRTTGKVIITDATNGIVVACSSSSMSGKLKSGSGLSGTDIASITALSFGGSLACTNGVLDYTYTFGIYPYDLNAESYANGRTTAIITGIRGAVSGGGCTMTIGGTTARSTGQISGTYTNSSHKFVTASDRGTMHFYNVGAGCLGLYNNGDRMTISATYSVSPAQTITSP